MTTADLYLRLSLDPEEATSIDRQEADYRRWCAAHKAHRQGGTRRPRSVRLRRDRHRDGFDAALAAVTTGEVDAPVSASRTMSA
jgi:hypothetical protein